MLFNDIHKPEFRSWLAWAWSEHKSNQSHQLEDSIKAREKPALQGYVALLYGVIRGALADARTAECMLHWLPVGTQQQAIILKDLHSLVPRSYVSK